MARSFAWGIRDSRLQANHTLLVEAEMLSIDQGSSHYLQDIERTVASCPDRHTHRLLHRILCL